MRLMLALLERQRVWWLSWQMLWLPLQVRETMRLVPVVGILIRKALKDFEVKGYHIPKVGSCVLLCGVTCKPCRPSSRNVRDRNVKGRRFSSGDNDRSRIASCLSGTGLEQHA